jgi:NAD(P)H-hydrate epimerase
MNSRMLISAENARLLDAEASADWALHPFALVEAAGRACADMFCAAFSRLFPGPPSRSAGGPFPRIAVLAGTGNNAADALVMLKALILRGFAAPGFSGIVVSRFPNGGDQSPRAESLRALKKMGVSAILWDGDAQEVAGRACEDMLALADIIIDGVTGTGLAGPLHGAALEMAGTVNRLKDGAHTPCPGLPRDDAGPPRSPAEFGQWSPALPPHPAGPPHPFEPPHPFRPLVVSIDVPSGNFDGWKTGMPILRADATLAIEPRKQCLYKPAARSFGGSLLPVEGIFPRQLIEKYGGPRLVDWEAAAAAIRPVDPGAHKYERGLVEIRAGSPGAAGAAKLAARGAQAAGAGLVRLIADPSIYPVLAAEAWGIMVVPGDASRHPEADNAAGRFRPDAVLLGPGWGTGPDRARLLENCLPLEEQGTPLILDADAITLAREMAFHGSAILTPHPGEFAAYTGISREEILSGPGPLLLDWARKKKAVILFKGPVLYIAAPDGRLGIVDGMAPCLATGGSGDILAGFCAALAARTRRQGYFDAYTCAAAAASLLIRAARSPELAGRFIDPVEITGPAASLAGAAWLPGYTASPTETGRHG